MIMAVPDWLRRQKRSSSDFSVRTSSCCLYVDDYTVLDVLSLQGGCYTYCVGELMWTTRTSLCAAGGVAEPNQVETPCQDHSFQT
jgi:hypothetical protein